MVNGVERVAAMGWPGLESRRKIGGGGVESPRRADSERQVRTRRGTAPHEVSSTVDFTLYIGFSNIDPIRYHKDFSRTSLNIYID